MFVSFCSFSYLNCFDDSYNSSPRVGILDVAATNFLRVLEFGLLSLRPIEVLYLKEIQLL
jgi:hypothetical protein